MIEGIHALARLDDEMNGFEYASVQVSVSRCKQPSVGLSQWENSKVGRCGWDPKVDEHFPPYTAP
eukprot:10143612-Prorocentrum_lima.AAC.1